MYLANRSSFENTPTPSMRRRHRLGPELRPAATRICAVSKAGAGPRLPTATRRGVWRT